jgi:hypothetical protein
LFGVCTELMIRLDRFCIYHSICHEHRIQLLIIISQAGSIVSFCRRMQDCRTLMPVWKPYGTMGLPDQAAARQYREMFSAGLTGPQIRRWDRNSTARYPIPQDSRQAQHGLDQIHRPSLRVSAAWTTRSYFDIPHVVFAFWLWPVGGRLSVLTKTLGSMFCSVLARYPAILLWIGNPLITAATACSNGRTLGIQSIGSSSQYITHPHF